MRHPTQLTEDETDAVVWYRAALAGYDTLTLPEKREVGSLLAAGQREVVFQSLVQRFLQRLMLPGLSEYTVQLDHPALVLR